MKTNFGLAGNKKIFKGVKQFDEDRINLTADSEYLPGNVNSWHTASPKAVPGSRVSMSTHNSKCHNSMKRSTSSP